MIVSGLATNAEILLDPRLAELWQIVWAREAELSMEVGGASEEFLAGLLRLAYLQGYADATSEPAPGELYRELGIRDPAITGRQAGRSRGARRRHGSSGR